MCDDFVYENCPCWVAGCRLQGLLKYLRNLYAEIVLCRDHAISFNMSIVMILGRELYAKMPE